MQTLWAPWRMAYIGGAKDPGCIFCGGAATADPRASLALARAPSGVVMLNRYPYANGHLMVAPRQHTADLVGLAPEVYGGLTDLLRQSIAILQQAFTPEGMNVGINLGRAAGAGIADHLHWHIVPRWQGDTNFMPLLAEVHVMPEHLEAVYDRLQPLFAHLDG